MGWKRVLVVGAAAAALLVGCGASKDDAQVKISDQAKVSTTTTERVTTTTEAVTTTTTAAPTTTTTAPPPPTTQAYVAPPTTQAYVAPPTTQAYVAPPPPAPSGGGCDPNYSGCVPVASDVDCAGGSGNGPAYTSGPVQVIGSDIYGLDADDDGVGCE